VLYARAEFKKAVLVHQVSTILW